MSDLKRLRRVSVHAMEDGASPKRGVVRCTIVSAGKMSKIVAPIAYAHLLRAAKRDETTVTLGLRETGPDSYQVEEVHADPTPYSQVVDLLDSLNCRTLGGYKCGAREITKLLMPGSQGAIILIEKMRAGGVELYKVMPGETVEECLNELRALAQRNAPALAPVPDSLEAPAIPPTQSATDQIASLPAGS